MKKYIGSILFALLIGFTLGKYMFNQYDEKEELTPVFNQSETLYFTQQGVYSTKESMLENTRAFSSYIYSIINNQYYVFIGITKNKKNSEKIKEFYSQMGYITYVREISVSNQDFLNLIDEYDLLLEQTTDEDALETIIREVITKYKELVVKNGEDTGNTEK